MTILVVESRQFFLLQNLQATYNARECACLQTLLIADRCNARLYCDKTAEPRITRFSLKSKASFNMLTRRHFLPPSGNFLPPNTRKIKRLGGTAIKSNFLTSAQSLLIDLLNLFVYGASDGCMVWCTAVHYHIICESKQPSL